MLKQIVIATILLAGLAIASPAHSQTSGDGIGYPSPQAAFRALQGNPNVSFSVEGGWGVAIDHSTVTIWSFAPPADPSYPAVVKRRVVEQSDDVAIQMSVLCGGTQAACDAMVARFSAMNAQLKAQIQSQHN